MRNMVFAQRISLGKEICAPSSSMSIIQTASDALLRRPRGVSGTISVVNLVRQQIYLPRPAQTATAKKIGGGSTGRYFLVLLRRPFPGSECTPRAKAAIVSPGGSTAIVLSHFLSVRTHERNPATFVHCHVLRTDFAHSSGTTELITGTEPGVSSHYLTHPGNQSWTKAIRLRSHARWRFIAKYLAVVKRSKLVNFPRFRAQQRYARICYANGNSISGPRTKYMCAYSREYRKHGTSYLRCGNHFVRR